MVQNLEPTLIDSDLVYPDSDGKPLADNTVQFRFIQTIYGGIATIFAEDPNVFVAGDLLWYPVQGSLKRQAPDVMVAFGRPKGDRGSYKQWEEGNIAPQVAFEILSPSNNRSEMERKLAFYELHGVEEYYEYNPMKNILQGWMRTGPELVPVPDMEGWVSPRLGVRFESHTGTLELYGPDGERFQSDVEARQQAKQTQQALQQAEQEAHRAEQEAHRAEQQMQARYDAIDRLLGLGLNSAQVAEALGFSMDELEAHLIKLKQSEASE